MTPVAVRVASPVLQQSLTLAGHAPLLLTSVQRVQIQLQAASVLWQSPPYVHVVQKPLPLPSVQQLTRSVVLQQLLELPSTMLQLFVSALPTVSVARLTVPCSLEEVIGQQYVYRSCGKR
ncbi:hypothetical protein DVH05_017087 [Phytophthora capsici]|nr:hypothetical protein DVH05_009787 [Phytophthora capsici]KAG1710079.1 hypothetical protein DVH05_017087 [Phytophthora capsici]